MLLIWKYIIMRGYLIYSKYEAKRNNAFIDLLILNAKKYSIDLRLLILEGFDRDVREKFNGDVQEDFNNIDFIINRTNDSGIAGFFESKGIYSFNNSSFSRLANDKAKAHFYAASRGVPVMESKIEKINFNSMKLPYVLKPRSLKGGEGVCLIKNRDDFDEYSACFDLSQSIQQEYCETSGRDLRVYILGGKIIASMIRISDTDFRSNYCLGGRAEKYDLENSDKQMIYELISGLNIDYAGVDFLIDENKLVFNEFEDPVGARMLYSEANIDIAKLFINYICDKIYR